MRSIKLKSATLRQLEGSLFIAPWVLGFLLFIAFPIGYSLFMSFHLVEILATGIKYTPVGMKYYTDILFTDGGLMYNDLLPFLRQASLMIPIIVVFALLIAILLNQKFYGRAFFRAIFFLPVIFSTGQIISEFITQGEGALGFIQEFDIETFINSNLPRSWAAPITNILSSFVIILWFSGVQILIFLAGRQTISHSVYEAARIDGASPWEVFWKITLPALTPFILLNLIYTVVDLFTFPSNPIIAKVSTANYGQSSALVWIYFIIILAFLGIIYAVFMRATKLSVKAR